MSAQDASQHAWIVEAIKSCKRNGLSIHSILHRLGVAVADDQHATLPDLESRFPQLTKRLIANTSLEFDSDLHKFYFKSAARFKAPEEFDDCLLRNKLVIVDDLESSFDGLSDYIEERRRNREVLVHKSNAGIIRVFPNPFYDLDLDGVPIPSADVIEFINNIDLPLPGDIEVFLRSKKKAIHRLDCLSAPSEPKSRQRAPTSIFKYQPSETDSLSNAPGLFTNLAAQAWGGTSLPQQQAIQASDKPASSESSVPQPTTTASNLKKNYFKVFDTTSNPEEWLHVRKVVYAIGSWFGSDLTVFLLGSFLEMRVRRDQEIFSLLGFMFTTNSAEKEQFRLKGFPDITRSHKVEKRELQAFLSTMSTMQLLRSVQAEHGGHTDYFVDLLALLNSAAYKVEIFETTLLQKIKSLNEEIMACTHCGMRYTDREIHRLVRHGNQFLCDNPNCTRLPLIQIDTNDEKEKLSSLVKKKYQIIPLIDLFAELQNRGVLKEKKETSSKPATPAHGRSEFATSRLKSLSTRGISSKSVTATSSKQARAEVPQFMAGMVTDQASEQKDIQLSDIGDFDLHPLKFGDPKQNDFRAYLPVVSDAAKSEVEIGNRMAKLLLDNIADFLYMTKLNPSDEHYHFCYEISDKSLFVAYKRGFRPLEMIRLLGTVSASVPPSIVQRILNQDVYLKFYRGTLVLYNCRYYVQSTELEVLKKIKAMPSISSYLVHPPNILQVQEAYSSETIYSLELKKETRSEFKEICSGADLPLIDEFSPTRQASWANLLPEAPHECVRMQPLSVVLTPKATVRDYQSMSCSKLYWDGFKCHSGILVLPCGAGKTLIGITALATLQYPCIIFCQSTLAVGQWANEIANWTNLTSVAISRFTSHHKKDWNKDASIIISTYSMFSSDSNRSSESQEMLNHIRRREWGIMILDEVHGAPAEIFQIVTNNITCHVKLGLTATLVREDEKVAILPSLVGPTLFELDVSTLRKRGHIAPIECHEIRLPFTDEWKRLYTNPRDPFWASAQASVSSIKDLLFTTNPNKILACVALIQKHLQEKHKIVIFCDDLIGLDCYRRVLSEIFKLQNCPLIQGSTPETVREHIVKEFTEAKNGAWLLFSKVGDMSIDLPEARVLIQIAATAGSRMQEGQRIGRIQRRFLGKTLAYAYSLVSGESKEELGFSGRRRSYLDEHGYSVQVHEMEQSSEFINTALDHNTEKQLSVHIRDELRKRAFSKTKEGKAALAARKEQVKRKRSEITPNPVKPSTLPNGTTKLDILSKVLAPTKKAKK